jgi:NADH-quinone oxidoreductase subunit E
MRMTQEASMSKLDEILTRHGRDKTALLAILQDIQDESNYLPRSWLEKLSAELDIPLTKIYRMATFFKALSMKPRGRHICSVCVGTTCHVRGAPRLIDKIERDYDLKPGQTTKDMELTLETVGCVGACALGPLVILDGKYFGHVTTDRLGKVFKSSLKES